MISNGNRINRKQLKTYILTLIEEDTELGGKSKKMNKNGGNLREGKKIGNGPQI